MPNEIIISSEENDIRTMIFKLMGRGLSTSLKRYGSFTITFEELSDLISKIQQRIDIQNDCAMSDFFAEFTFSDGSTDRIPSFEAFHGYRCINRHICIKAKLKMAFIVRFNKRGSEKQNVDITFESTDLSSIKYLGNEKRIKT